MIGSAQPIADFRLSVAGAGEGGSALDLDAARILAQLVDITSKVRPRLIGLTLTEKRGGEADQLSIGLDDSDGRLTLPKKGALIRLQLGWLRGSGVPIGLVDKGSFTVDEVSWEGAADVVTITARSADLTDSFRVRREHGWTDTTLGAIAREVAARNGYRTAIDPALAAIAVAVRAQHHTSDMALLMRLGREHDAVATVKNRTLILSPIGKGASPSGRALGRLILTRADVAERCSYRELDRSADAGVEARWHDAKSGTRKTVTVGGSKSAKGRPHRVRRVYHSEADAGAAAQAAHARAQRAAATFEGALALGRPDITPERPVTLKGFKPAIDAQRWIVSQLDHSLDGQGGLATRFQLETTG